jgi:hypothetical protein
MMTSCQSRIQSKRDSPPLQYHIRIELTSGHHEERGWAGTPDVNALLESLWSYGDVLTDVLIGLYEKAVSKVGASVIAMGAVDFGAVRESILAEFRTSLRPDFVGRILVRQTTLGASGGDEVLVCFDLEQLIRAAENDGYLAYPTFEECEIIVTWILNFMKYGKWHVGTITKDRNAVERAPSRSLVCGEQEEAPIIWFGLEDKPPVAMWSISEASSNIRRMWGADASVPWSRVLGDDGYFGIWAFRERGIVLKEDPNERFDAVRKACPIDLGLPDADVIAALRKLAFRAAPVPADSSQSSSSGVTMNAVMQTYVDRIETCPERGDVR